MTIVVFAAVACLGALSLASSLFMVWQIRSLGADVIMRTPASEFDDLYRQWCVDNNRAPSRIAAFAPYLRIAFLIGCGVAFFVALSSR